MRSFIEVPSPIAQTPKPDGITWAEIGVVIGVGFPIVSGIITATAVITAFKGAISTLKAELLGEFKVVNNRLESLEKGQCDRDATINDLKSQSACNKGNIQALTEQLNNFGLNVHTRNTR